MGLTLLDKKNVLVQPLRNERLVCPVKNDHFSFSHAVMDIHVGCRIKFKKTHTVLRGALFNTYIEMVNYVILAPERSLQLR